MRKVRDEIPPVDILIDDGGHTMRQQIITYQELFGHIKETGVYLNEDLHTSYWLNYGGGHKRNGTFIEYTKNFIDQLNAYHSEQNSLKVSEFTRSVDSVHYYDSIVVIEKRKVTAPYSEKTGTPSFFDPGNKQNTPDKIVRSIARITIKYLNKLLRFFRIKSVVLGR